MDTYEEEILALIGVLLLSCVDEDNHTTTIEMFKHLLGIPAYRTAFSERTIYFLLRCIRFDDPEMSDERRIKTRSLPSAKFGKFSITTANSAIVLEKKIQ